MPIIRAMLVLIPLSLLAGCVTPGQPSPPSQPGTAVGISGFVATYDVLDPPDFGRLILSLDAPRKVMDSSGAPIDAYPLRIERLDSRGNPAPFRPASDTPTHPENIVTFLDGDLREIRTSLTCNGPHEPCSRQLWSYARQGMIAPFGLGWTKHFDGGNITSRIGFADVVLTAKLESNQDMNRLTFENAGSLGWTSWGGEFSYEKNGILPTLINLKQPGTHSSPGQMRLVSFRPTTALPPIERLAPYDPPSLVNGSGLMPGGGQDPQNIGFTLNDAFSRLLQEQRTVKDTLASGGCIAASGIHTSRRYAESLGVPVYNDTYHTYRFLVMDAGGVKQEWYSQVQVSRLGLKSYQTGREENYQGTISYVTSCTALNAQPASTMQFSDAWHLATMLEKTYGTPRVPILQYDGVLAHPFRAPSTSHWGTFSYQFAFEDDEVEPNASLGLPYYVSAIAATGTFEHLQIPHRIAADLDAQGLAMS